MSLVYLAGPIEGQSFMDATLWRREAAAELLDLGVRSLDPLRGKQALRDLVVTAPLPSGPQFSTAGIAMRNWSDMQRCDVVLANLLAVSAQSPGLGTVLELGWAWALRKPVVAVRHHTCPFDGHPILHAALGAYRFDTLDAAITGVVDVLGVSP